MIWVEFLFIFFYNHHRDDTMEYIESINIDNKRVILRLDLNVTIKDGKILDDTKIKKGIPTIKYLLNHNANILIMSHLGKIKTDEDKKNNSLEQVSYVLSELLEIPVKFIKETRSEELINSTFENRVTLMENTRYEDLPNKCESGCDDELAKYWSSAGEIFINDAFGTTHRCHASNYGISKYLPSAYGFLIKEELNGLDPIVHNIEKPFVVIMGGAKVDDKVALIESLLKECDYLLVGGGIANTFLKACGYNVGNSLYSSDYVEKIKTLLDMHKNKIWMPVDVIIKSGGEINTVGIDEIPSTGSIYDIGPKSVDIYKKILKESSTIFVNGTMGLYEDESFRNGTENLYKALSNINATIIAGGGDAIASIKNLGYQKNFDFLSTGGGATLEYISEKKLKCFGEN